MKASAFAFAAIVAFAPIAISTAHAGELSRTGTAYEVAKQYADGGKYGGVTTGHTGTVLEVAQDSLNFLGTPDRVASTWRMPRIVAKGA
jgi:hypothetical protein